MSEEFTVGTAGPFDEPGAPDEAGPPAPPALEAAAAGITAVDVVNAYSDAPSAPADPRDAAIAALDRMVIAQGEKIATLEARLFDAFRGKV